jgi:glycolate oxidase iron-sulfur subunit
METCLSPDYKDTADGNAAQAILRTCVHCGFCTATCPTYQLLGDELDGPRGRIYLIKQVLEGAEVTRSTQQHLDRCLTCRSCETTCPSGVEYGRLIDIGRRVVETRVQRPAAEKAARWLLKEGLRSPAFGPAVGLGRLVRPLVPAGLRNKLPAKPAAARANRRPPHQHLRKVLMPVGCVQPSLMPGIDRATVRVLDACGIQAVAAPAAGCCGALRLHLNDQAGALRDMRRNVEAWWPLIEAGAAEAIVANASGCGVMIKDYAHALAHDDAWARRAAAVSAATRDLSELLPEIVPRLAGRLRAGAAGRTVVHSPCTLQHGQRLRGGIAAHLATLGFDVGVPADEDHLCCGSAGTYALLQPKLAYALRDRKLQGLSALQPQVVVSANIGCIQHLQSGTGTPVKHWVEVLDDALDAAPASA